MPVPPSSPHSESAPNNNDTPIHPIVKEQYIPDTPTKRNFQVQLQGHVLWALEEYAKENNLRNPAALRDLLEFRLFQLGKLPDWWYERGELLRKR